MTTLKAASQILHYAKLAIEEGDWLRGVAYLQCMDAVTQKGVWVSPWNVADLYHRLGRHYESTGQVEQAILAYGEASDWHPGVWSAPYVRKAQLLGEQGRTKEAILWLTAGIPRSTDATSTFYLWQAIGEFMLMEDNKVDGYCAFQRALNVMNLVPSQNLSAAARQAIRQSINDLATRIDVAETICSPDSPSSLNR